MALVFWKDSVDFVKIIKKQQNDIPNRFAGQSGSPIKDQGNYKREADKAIADFNKFCNDGDNGGGVAPYQGDNYGGYGGGGGHY